MIKIMTLLLVFLAVLGVFGRIRFPAHRPKRKVEARCNACGRPRIGPGPCPCGRAG